MNVFESLYDVGPHHVKKQNCPIPESPVFGADHNLEWHKSDFIRNQQSIIKE